MKYNPYRRLRKPLPDYRNEYPAVVPYLADSRFRCPFCVPWQVARLLCHSSYRSSANSPLTPREELALRAATVFNPVSPKIASVVHSDED